MAGEPQPEFFDFTHTLAGIGEDRVLLGIGRHHLAVVAREVSGLEVAREHDAHRHVPDLMHGPAGSTLGDADHMRLRLPVLVFTEADRHVPR